VTHHTYTVEDGPKMLRETLSVAQAAVGWRASQGGEEQAERAAPHRARLQRLIDECERKRPTGPDGGHGDRHTPECGCEDPEVEWAVRAAYPGKPFLHLPVPTRAHAEQTAGSINADDTQATAEVLWRPASGWRSP
jgi:hypothetical protein